LAVGKWLKISDPDAPMPDLPLDGDVRVLLPADGRFDVLANKVRTAGGAVRRVAYLIEEE
jgi:helicase